MLKSDEERPTSSDRNICPLSLMYLGLLGLTWHPWWPLWSSSHSPACTLLSRGAPGAWKDSSPSVTKLGDWASGGFPSAFQHRPLLPTHPDSGEQRTGPWLSSLSPSPHWAGLNLKSEVLGFFLCPRLGASSFIVLGSRGHELDVF